MTDQQKRPWHIDQAYIGGAFVRVRGSETVESVNPATD
jgi:hypothetical protein